MISPFRLLPIAILAALAAWAAPEFSEDFATLDDWRPLTFRKIDRHSTYQAVEHDGATAVQLNAAASASGLVAKTTFSATKTPYLTFRWKVDQIWAKGDATRKDGDDYPVRIYVAFVYDPNKASFTERLTYGAAKVRLGKYPPHSSLNYVWANRHHTKRILPSPYTDRAQLVCIDSGAKHVGSWRQHTVNVLDDYRKAFGKNPPAEAQLAIMIDADNTNDKGRSWIDFIKLDSTPPKN